MKTYKCEYCGREDFKNAKSYGGHFTSCEMNPNALSRILKISKERSERLITDKICPRCGNIFKVVSTDKRLYKTKKYCSSVCAYTHKATEETKEKISDSVKDRIKEIGYWGRSGNGSVSVNCVICNKSFIKPFSKKQQTCSKECKCILISKKCKGRTGGPRKGGGFGKHSDYLMRNGKIFHCQSAMEYKMCEILDNLKLDWNRNTKGFKYTTIDGKLRRYYPDFYVKDFDLFIETKGFINEEINHKMKCANITNLLIIKTNKFGGNWNEIVIDNKILMDMMINMSP